MPSNQSISQSAPTETVMVGFYYAFPATGNSLPPNMTDISMSFSLLGNFILILSVSLIVNLMHFVIILIKLLCMYV